MACEDAAATCVSGYVYKVSNDVATSLLDVLASRGWTDIKAIQPDRSNQTPISSPDPTTRWPSRRKSSPTRILRRSRSAVGNRKKRWHLYWKTTRFTKDELDEVTSDAQRINHFARTSEITKKDALIRILRRMKAVHGAIYNFFPESYILPGQYREFGKRFHQPENSTPMWIIKPCASSQGRDIYIVRSLSELKNDTACVAQRYIQNCLTISGYKFDLRIYVLVTSFHPLRIYIYRRGLCRFSSERYDLKDLGNLFSHLTNSSINRHSPSVQREKSTIGVGCKWTLWKLLEHLRADHRVDIVKLWRRIKNIVLLTLLPLVGEVPANPSAFELFGFDIMLDQDYKPWLLEVNSSPAIATYGKEDAAVKYPLLNDLLDILGFKEDEAVTEISAPRLLRSVSLKDQLCSQKHRRCRNSFAGRASSRAGFQGVQSPSAKHSRRASERYSRLSLHMLRPQAQSGHKFSSLFTSIEEEARTSSFWEPFAPTVARDSCGVHVAATMSSNVRNSIAPLARTFGLFEEVYPWSRAVTDHGRGCLATDSQVFSSTTGLAAWAQRFRRDVVHELKARSFKKRQKVARASRRATRTSFAFDPKERNSA